jgi:type I restriction enzyme S subunit
MVRIGDVCDVLNGFAFKSENYVDSGIRIIRIANVQKGFIEDNTPAFYPIGSEGIGRFMLDEGDLLMSLTGNVGRVAIIAKEFLPAALNQRVACLRIKSNNVLKRYLFHIFNSDFFEQKCIESSKGVAQKNMSTEWLKDYEIPLYSLEKQKEIVEILDNALQIMTERKQQLLTLDTLIKARFVEMFGDPEINPMKWEEQQLSELLTVLGGYAFKSEGFDEVNGIPVLRIGNINAGFFKPVNMVFWPEDKSLERYILYPGDLVMSLTGTVGKDDYGNVCILGNEYEKYYLNQRNAKLVITTGLDKAYLSQLLRFEKIKNRLTGISRGVRQANISNRDILGLCVPVPPLGLQKQFATFVYQVDKSKVVVQKAMDEAQLLFDSLTQKYFG